MCSWTEGRLTYLGRHGREMEGGQPERVPAGYGQDFRFYSRDGGKPSVGVKQGQDMV